MMHTSTAPLTTGLYPRLLGSTWNDVNESVKRLHVESAPIHATGYFCICHGTSRLARWLLWLMRLPSAGEAVLTQLEVSPCRGGEKWVRTFAGELLVTTQWAKQPDLLAERYGMWELRFHLRVEGGALLYEQAGAALRFANFAVPLPKWIAPRITAREEKSLVPNSTNVDVQVFIPGGGLLISYEGVITKEEGT